MQGECLFRSKREFPRSTDVTFGFQDNFRLYIYQFTLVHLFAIFINGFFLDLPNSGLEKIKNPLN